MTANIDVLVEKKNQIIRTYRPIFFQTCYSNHTNFFWPDFHSVNNSEFPRHLTSKH